MAEHRVFSRPRRGTAEILLRALAYADTDECVPWPWGRRSAGYAALGEGYGHTKVCEWANGPRPEGHQAAHNCGQASCVNHRHLRWATHAENQSDKVGHDTHTRGGRSHFAKLTEDQVRSIRSQYEAGRLQREIADDFGIDGAYVSMLVNHKAWAWLD